jgi:hypothetical protein
LLLDLGQNLVAMHSSTRPVTTLGKRDSGMSGPAGAPLSTIPIRGDSMWPTLRDGDEAVVVQGPRTFRPGEVVVARTEGAIVVHRVLKVAERSITLKGDNCGRSDSPVPLSAVLGRVETVIRGGKAVPAEAWDVGPTTRGWFRARLRRTLRWLWRGRA